MATSTAAAIVTVDYSRLKLLCILEGPGAAVLSHALKCGTKKTPSATLLDHLINLPDSSTANFRHLNGTGRRKAFTSEEKRNIANDPSCQTFDITLLYKCIKVACEDVAGSNDARWQDTTVMEGLLTKIKDERNLCVHERPQMTDEQEFKNKVLVLKRLFIRAIQAVKDKYGVSSGETTDVIDNIRRQIQDVLLAFTDKVILRTNFDKRLLLFKQMAVCHLRGIYNDFKYIDPLFFLSGSQENRVNIQTVFSKLVLEQQPEVLDINCFDMLEVLTQDQKPSLAVVTGIAGSGKSTLLTFILSEWLKEECDRRITHLEEYDIVLRILCRDTDADDLDTFLDLVLPSSLSVFNEPHIKYLKNCRVLFLIDGLDEMNITSEKLVADILNITKFNKGKFSILATSRPEPVDHFLARTRQHFKQSQISIKGIPVKRRMEFAMQYCTSTSKDRLKEYITTHGDMSLFELPLNLIFLVTLIEDSPDCITTKVTQSSLYTNIHEWCIEKLHHRLSVHPIWGNNEPQTLKMRIKRVLKEVYQMALQGLLQDRLSLSDEDIKRLEDCCKREGLPSHQVLGAFFTLSSSITNRIVNRKYHAPHKGLLEYFAAQHIMLRLQDGSLPPSGAIKILLHTANQPQTQRSRLPDRFISLLGPIRNLLHTDTKSQTFRGLGNLFFQVAGLLVMEEVPNYRKKIKEIIELVGKTGANWKEWLSLVEHTDYDESFLQGITHHVTKNPPCDTLIIEDNTLTSAAALLPRTPQTTVALWLDNESVNVKNVHALTHHYCRDLNLQHHYRNPSNIPASDVVLRAIDRSRLGMFIGHLSADCVALLPECLQCLYLAVSSDDSATCLTTALNKSISSLPNLSELKIHVPVAMVTRAMVASPLPDIATVYLMLSGVNESLVKEACLAAAALQPRKGYWVIGFPQGRMEAAEWQHLLQLMAAAPITMENRLGWSGGFVIPEETITVKEQKTLSRLTRTLFGCAMLRVNDENHFIGYTFVFPLEDDELHEENEESDDEEDEEEED